MSKEELLALEAEFEARRYEIRRQAAEQARALVDPDRDPVEYARRSEQLLELERQYRQRRAELMRQAATQIGEIWTDLGNRTTRLWDSGINAMMSGTLTWRNAMRAAGAEMVGFFSNLVKNHVKAWMLGEQAKTGATAAGTAQRLMMESWAAAKSVALWAAAAVKNIMSSAWEAMAAAWKAVVGIPVVGPVLAPIAAGAAFAGVSALANKVVSAQSGYDIPAGVNPLVQAHEREMILPAEIAEPVREMVATGGGQRRGGGDTFVIQALDSRSFEHALRRNGVALARGVRDAVRDGR
jgi:hypothetical protein